MAAIIRVIRKKRFWALVVLVALVATCVTAVLASKPEFVWVDPPPARNSLALEAQRKLTGDTITVIDKGGTKSIKKKRPKTAKAVSFKGPYIVIDTHTNHIYWRTTDSVLFSALCSTGTGAELIDTVGGRKWVFDTPRGVFAVDSRVSDPWWRKPDWAFIEEGEPIPTEEDDRLDPEVMGEFAIGFGDGFFIHGTLYERLIGVSVTHGCVRLASSDLEYLYPKVRLGTPVVVF